MIVELVEFVILFAKGWVLIAFDLSLIRCLDLIVL